MQVEVNPKETSRASAYELWMQALNPMVTFYLPVSFQFHHTQMDGAHAAKFLDTLQREIDGMNVD
jgi:chloramphenicol O-acetyltransferase type A